MSDATNTTDDDYNPELELPSTSTSLSNKNNNTTIDDKVPTNSTTPPHPPSNLSSSLSSNNNTPNRVKNVKFADHDTEITHTSYDKLASNSAETDDNSDDNDNDDFSNQNDIIKVIDDNEDNNYDPTILPNLPAKPYDSKDTDSKINENLAKLDATYSNINVPLFNEIVQFFITGPLFNDHSFNSLSPPEKETTVLNAYEISNNKQVNPEEVNLNFAATTSYNKINMKQNDERQLLVPINPYCRRPDLTLVMDSDERYQFDEFRRAAEKHSKEFECLDFPAGSRLFIGNLAVNSLKISDVWRVFKRYGNVKAINMKQGYGFVQFTNADACHKAIQGEEHVPLHNRLMHLEISKTHEKHTKDPSKIKETKERERGRDRDRNRERERDKSPRRKINERQRSPVRSNKEQNKKVRVIISIESEASFNHLLVNSLNEVGLECTIKHIESTANEIPQEIITESAYSGVVAAIVTSKMEMVNLFLFQRDSDDGAIKFDEYEDISMESAINYITNQIKKSSKPTNNTNMSDSYRPEYNNRNVKNRNDRNDRNNRGDHNDRRRNQDRDNYSRNDRYDRNDRRRNNNNNSNNNNRHNNNNNRHNDNNRRNDNNRHNDRRSNFPRYSPRQQEAQKHLPPQVTPMGNQYLSPNQMYPQQQDQQYYGNPRYNTSPQQQYYQTNNQNPVASQLVNQLASLDENSLKTMLSMVTQQQQQQQQQQRPMGSPHGHMGNSGLYIPQQHNPPPPINLPSNTGNAGVGNLLTQLQNMTPGTNAPAATNNYNNNPPPQERDNQQNGGDDTSRLFETLARLKNNM